MASLSAKWNDLQQLLPECDRVGENVRDALDQTRQQTMSAIENIRDVNINPVLKFQSPSKWSEVDSDAELEPHGDVNFSMM